MPSVDQSLSVSACITRRVMRLPKGQPFSISRFKGVGSRNAISKAIARLIKRGELERVYPGIYMRPKPSRYSAKAHVNPWQLINLIAREKRLTLQIHGANALRKFGLGTQVPLASGQKPTSLISFLCQGCPPSNGTIDLRLPGIIRDESLAVRHIEPLFVAYCHTRFLYRTALRRLRRGVVGSNPAGCAK